MPELPLSLYRRKAPGVLFDSELEFHGGVMTSRYGCLHQLTVNLSISPWPGPGQPLPVQNMQEGFAYPEAWSWAALEERFGDNVVRVSLSETGR